MKRAASDRGSFLISEMMKLLQQDHLHVILIAARFDAADVCSRRDVGSRVARAVPRNYMRPNRHLFIADQRIDFATHDIVDPQLHLRSRGQIKPNLCRAIERVGVVLEKREICDDVRLTGDVNILNEVRDINTRNPCRIESLVAKTPNLNAVLFFPSEVRIDRSVWRLARKPRRTPRLFICPEDFVAATIRQHCPPSVHDCYRAIPQKECNSWKYFRR